MAQIQGGLIEELMGDESKMALSNQVPVRLVLLTLLLEWAFGVSAWAGIHRAPIIIPANKIRAIAQYPIKTYRVFRTTESGEAIPIPFQIDEINKIGDYVLNQGPQTNATTGDGIFSELDELSFMGDDVGLVVSPSKWPEGRAPHAVFEVKITPPAGSAEAKEGAVYVGVYLQNAPKLVEQKYVIFNLNSGEVLTSRYRYLFDQKNYMVVNGVEMIKPLTGSGQANVPLIDSSTFYAKVDLKYFLTLQVNHRSVNSRLEAFKTGPVRTIVRVTFLYQFLNLNFEVGMYTEVSFFSNSVILPAIIYNPLDGIKSLNNGSGFYYGFALRDSPNQFEFNTNMKAYSEAGKASGILSFLKKEAPPEKEYWASLIGEDRMMYVLMRPSQQMLQDSNVPYYYVNDINGQELKKRNNNDTLSLLESPVNLGLYFDLTRFREGEHFMSFQLFFENKKDYKNIELFKSLDRWMIKAARLF
jgi:hypothetical protein